MTRSLLLVAALVSLGASPSVAEGLHVVQPGETLWQIAGEVAGDPHLWPILYRANRDQIKDPSQLYPGQELTIPDFEAEPVGPAPVGGGPRPSDE